MRTIIIKNNIYEYDELTEEAKAKARSKFYGEFLDDFSDEQNSLEAIGRIIGDAGYSLDAWNNVNVSLTVKADDDIYDLKGTRLVKWVYNNWIEPNEKGKYYGKFVKRNGHLDHINYYSKATKEWNCPLTGFCMDMVLYECYKYMVKKTKEGEAWNLEKFVEEVADEFRRQWQNEIDYRSSDEYIEGMIEANNYEFYEDGSFYKEG